MLRKFIIIILFCLGGCQSNIKKNWDCPLADGGSCKNIQDIDYGIQDNKNGFDLKQASKIKPAQNKQSKSAQTSNVFQDLRSRESIARVRFAPYIDAAGNRHEKKFVYYIETSSDWTK